MVVVGNALLLLATLTTVGVAALQAGKTPPRGEALMGYSITVILLNLVFALCMILATWIIASRGGYEWVSSKRTSRFVLVSIGVLSALCTSALSSLFRYEVGPVPALIRFYSAFAQYLIPLLLIAGSAVLLNGSSVDGLRHASVKWSLILAAVIGITGVVSIVVDWMASSLRKQAATREYVQSGQDPNRDRMLIEIDSADITKGIVTLLVFTGDNQHPEVQRQSVEKVKTHPYWQDELIRLLRTDWAPEPFQFLASNDVDDPRRFAEPIHDGVLIQARLIRERIRSNSHPSNFYPGLFSYEVERVVRTVDKYKGMGVDFRPAMRELRAALDEHSEFDKPKFVCIKLLDQWIKKNP